MRILSFTVDGQKLSKSGDFSNIVRGSKGYLQCKFSFEGNDWDRHKVIAVFTTNDDESAIRLNPDKTCMVPDEVTDAPNFKMELVGVLGDKKITTNKEIIEQRW